MFRSRNTNNADNEQDGISTAVIMSYDYTSDGIDINKNHELRTLKINRRVELFKKYLNNDVLTWKRGYDPIYCYKDEAVYPNDLSYEELIKHRQERIIAPAITAFHTHKLVYQLYLIDGVYPK